MIDPATDVHFWLDLQDRLVVAKEVYQSRQESMDKMHGPTDQEMEFRDLNYVDLKAINTVIHVATKEANHIERKRL